MAKKPETHLQQKIRAALKVRYPRSWWVKFHGGMFSAAGVPDLLGCVNGKFFAFEVKCPGKLRTLTPIQAHVIDKLQRAGACACTITSIEEALAIVGAAAPAPTEWCALRAKSERILSSIRAENGEDLVYWRVLVANQPRGYTDSRVQEQPKIDVAGLLK